MRNIRVDLSGITLTRLQSVSMSLGKPYFPMVEILMTALLTMNSVQMELYTQTEQFLQRLRK